jgi:hypothetical protein
MDLPSYANSECYDRHGKAWKPVQLWLPDMERGGRWTDQVWFGTATPGGVTSPRRDQQASRAHMITIHLREGEGFDRH